MKTWLGAGISPTSTPTTWCTEYWMDDPDLPWMEAALEVEAMEEARRMQDDPQVDHLERDAEPVVDEHPKMTNQPKGDTLKVPCTSEGPAKIENTAKRQVMEPYNQTSE
jgi:hypothetical protein